MRLNKRLNTAPIKSVGFIDYWFQKTIIKASQRCFFEILD